VAIASKAAEEPIDFQSRQEADWHAAMAEHTPEAYSTYLAAWPQGHFAHHAQTLIDHLNATENSEDDAQWDCDDDLWPDDVEPWD
jgi:hypothetical protein